MTPPDYSTLSFPPQATDGTRRYFQKARARRHTRYWLHLLLLLITLYSTSAVGARMQQNFRNNRPFFEIERDFSAFLSPLSNPAVILQGLPFSLTLLAILLAHEFGHYIACRYYGLDVSLPYFLPSPSFAGTFGAFIRIRSPIYSRRALFDVGIAGPIAGFVFLLPALGIGLALSKILPGIAHQGTLNLGTPGLLWILERIIFPGVASSDIYLHPVARAAWIGILATALNLLPIGQLDGGHILYSAVGEKHRLLSRIFVAALVFIAPFSWSWWGWLVWAVLLFFFGLRHPVIYDTSKLGAGRLKLAWAALAMFLLCFTFAPIQTPGRGL